MAMTIPVSSKALRAFRESKNLSQAEFADLIKVNGSTISNLENGRANIGPVVLAKYRKAGFRLPNLSPTKAPIKESAEMPPLVVSALQVLEQNAPHLLHQDDATGAALHRLEESLSRKLALLDDLIRAVDGGLIARMDRTLLRLDRLEAMMTAAMEPEPELKNTDRGPDDPRE